MGFGEVMEKPSFRILKPSEAVLAAMWLPSIQLRLGKNNIRKIINVE